MQESYIITQEATTAPVTAEQLRNHLLLFGDTSFDDELTELILVAQKLIADEIGEFPTATEIRQPYRFLTTRLELIHKYVDAITSVQYYDSSNVLQTLDTSNYLFDNMSATKRVIITDSSSITLSSDYPAPLFVNYEAAFTAIPETVEQALLICAAEMWYQRRNSTDSPRASAPINGSFLISNLKRRLR